MTTLAITPEEVSSGKMSAEHLEAAVDAMRRDGFVVLERVVDLDHLERLREKLIEDLPALLAREDPPFNWNTGNLQQDPPPFHPYLFRDVLLNDMVVAVTRRLLGRGVKNTLYTGNTALPSRERQPVHADGPHLWEDLEVAHPVASVVVNLPVVDMVPENGSTEIWPGSHRDTTIRGHRDIKVPPEVVERRRAVSPPLQPTLRRGDVLLRDVRLWHAGMPNLTAEPRPMMAMIHTVSWLDTGDPLVFPKDAEAFFAGSEPRMCARFVDEPIDHIRAPQAYEYPPEEKGARENPS